MAILAILWPLAKFGQIWVLITILGEDNFTSQFYVTRVAIPEKAVLLTSIKTKWPFLAKFGKILLRLQTTSVQLFARHCQVIML